MQFIGYTQQRGLNQSQRLAPTNWQNFLHRVAVASQRLAQGNEHLRTALRLG
jgi:hypothetical protein